MVLYIIGWHCSYQRLWALQDSGRCRIWGGGVACRIDTRMAAAMEDMNLPFPSTYLAAFYIYVIPSSAHVSRHMGKVPLLWRLAFRAIAPPLWSRARRILISAFRNPAPWPFVPDTNMARTRGAATRQEG